ISERVCIVENAETARETKQSLLNWIVGEARSMTTKHVGVLTEVVRTEEAIRATEIAAEGDQPFNIKEAALVDHVSQPPVLRPTNSARFRFRRTARSTIHVSSFGRWSIWHRHSILLGDNLGKPVSNPSHDIIKDLADG